MQQEIGAVNATAESLKTSVVELDANVEGSKSTVESLAANVASKLMEHDEKMEAAKGFHKQLQDYMGHIHQQARDEVATTIEGYLQRAKTMEEQVKKQLENMEQRVQSMRGDGGPFAKNSQLNHPQDFKLEKLKDSVSKCEFGHWVACLGLHLGSPGDWKTWGRVLIQEVRKAKQLIDNTMLQEAAGRTHTLLGREVVTWYSVDAQSRFTELWSFLYPRLNTDMIVAVGGIDHNNGFEVFRRL